MTTYTKSRYIVLSDHEYVGADGGLRRLAYSTRTGKVFPVGRSVVTSLENGTIDDIPANVVEALVRTSLLVRAGADEPADILAENIVAAQDRSRLYISLLPTAYCNMSCAYCGQEHRRGQLGREHRDLVRERVVRRLRQPETKRAKICWFGAEPMMGYSAIRDLAKDFIATADECGVPYESLIVTNGTLLTADNIGVLARECRIGHFEITLDGPPEVHDRHRPLKSGGKSFWRIIDTVRPAVERHPDVNWQFRTNVDKNNEESVGAYLELMAKLGFGLPNVSFSIARVHPWGNDVSAFESSLGGFAAREAGWLEQAMALGLRTPLLPGGRRTSVCSVVTRAEEHISATGAVFSCNEEALVPRHEQELALGNVRQRNLPLLRPVGPYDDWNESVANGEAWCRDCVFLPICGGACPKSWREGRPPCPSYKLNIQQRIDMVARQSGYRRVDG
ncbi:radical SAM protein [Phytohabitans kaempferiae]|uniref:Radical SAM protein n=1 Tax=Phytohabitans kaempferiae TaxID=1620943 RepID=A0ABV6M574_9ACTN